AVTPRVPASSSSSSLTLTHSLSLHDALPIWPQYSYWTRQLAGAPSLLDLPIDYPRPEQHSVNGAQQSIVLPALLTEEINSLGRRDRKSTRLNSSHQIISYAVCCVQKKKKTLL